MRRLIAIKRADNDEPVQILEPSRSTFRGTRGTLYHDGRIYHHGSGSFLASEERRLSRKVHRATEIAHRRAVMNGQFQLNLRQRLALSARSRLRL